MVLSVFSFSDNFNDCVCVCFWASTASIMLLNNIHFSFDALVTPSGKESFTGFTLSTHCHLFI